MKGKARRLLSWVCVLALCMSLLPVTALADGITLPKPENGVITLTENVTLSDTYEVKGNDDVTIDLAGYDLNYDGNGGVFLNVQSGSLTIRDSEGTGVVTVNEPKNTGTESESELQTVRCVQVCAGATFTLESGTLTNTNTAFEATQVITNYGTTNIEGGVVKGVTGIFIFNPTRGNPSWTSYSATCNVSGGSIEGGSLYHIYGEHKLWW